MKARIVSIQLVFEVVADDGETLRRVNMQPVVVPADQIDAIPQGVRSVLAQVQQQLDAQTAQITAPGD